jgi:pseudouridine-5'-phosphate glycosidase
VLDGSVCIGLDDQQLESLANGTNILKLNRRDLSAAIVQKQSGATTVSATMYIAARAGIRLFATGGIGGVHRENAHDVSADLYELASTPVAVVCAGAKAILDLPATLEFLETFSVPVIGYQTDEFPAFYSRSSGLSVPARANSPEQVAQIAAKHWEMGNHSGLLICVPIPESDELSRKQVAAWIEPASNEVIAKGISGKNITPFILSRLAELSNGVTVRANIALLRNNVAVAAKIARAFSELDLPQI